MSHPPSLYFLVTYTPFVSLTLSRYWSVLVFSLCCPEKRVNDALLLFHYSDTLLFFGLISRLYASSRIFGGFVSMF